MQYILLFEHMNGFEIYGLKWNNGKGSKTKMEIISKAYS